MAKGAYDINETNVGPTKDGSFRSMLCAMLVFVAICGIIIIVAWPWKNYGGNEKPSSDNSYGTSDSQTGNKFVPKKDEPTTTESVRTTSSNVHKTTRKPENTRKPVTQKEIQEDLSNEDEVTTVADPNKSVETFTEDNPNLGTTKLSKEYEKIVQSTTVGSVPTTPSHVDNSTQNIKKPAELVTETEETTLITGTAGLSNNTESDNKSDGETTTSRTTVDSNIKKGDKNEDDRITTNAPSTNTTLVVITENTTSTVAPKGQTEAVADVETTTSYTLVQHRNDAQKNKGQTTIDDIETTTNTLVQHRNEAHKDKGPTTTDDVETTTYTIVVQHRNEDKKNNGQTTIDDAETTTTTLVQLRNEAHKNQEQTTIDDVETTTNTIVVQHRNEDQRNNGQTTIDDVEATTNTSVNLKNEEQENETTTLPTTMSKRINAMVTDKDDNTTVTNIDSTEKDEKITTPTPKDESTTLPTLKDKKTILPTSINESTTTPTLEDENTTLPTLEDETTTFPTTSSTQRAIMETENVVHRRITEPPRNIIQNNDECKAECRKIGARILSRMNHFVDPCEQFYDYACGSDNSDNAPEDNWKRIADGLDRIQPQSPDVYKTFQKFYETCVDFHTDYHYGQRVFLAKDILSKVDLPTEDGIDENVALTDLLTRLLLLDSSPLFDISVDVDKEDHFIFQLNVGKRFSNQQNDNSVKSSKRKCLSKGKKYLYFSSSSDYMNLNKMQEVYLNCMKNETYKIETVVEALEALDDSNIEIDEASDHVKQIIEIYKELPSAASIREDIITKKYVVRKVSELEFHYPLIKWKQLLSNLVGKDVHDEDLVQVHFKDFFFKIFSRRSSHALTSSQLHDAILAMYIHDLYVNLVLPTSMEDPEEYCLHQSSDLMKEVASSLYLESIKQKDYEGDLKRVNDLFSKMKTKLQDMLENNAEWLNVPTKISLTKKINKMQLDTAWDHTLLWKNISLIQERMKSINRTYGNYSDFTAALVRRNRQLLYSMWDTRSDMETYVWWHFLTPYSTKPVSIYVMNRIAIPPAMLLTDSKDIPLYLSLAKLGYSLAKAVGYHFDSTGSRFDMSLDSKAQAAYKEADTCAKLLQFNKTFKVEHDGKNIQFEVNDDTFNLTLNERFAEDMAIHLLAEMSNEDVTDYQISWIASNSDLSDTFSREKMFFIALGQEHCRKSSLEDYFLHLFESEHLPPSLVLNMALSHSELFADTFKCKGGSHLNAEFKCNAFPVWPEPDPDQYNDYGI